MAAKRHRIAVLGAGIAGLTAGHLLSQMPSVSVEIFESQAVVGGRANVDGAAEHCQRLFMSDYSTLLSIIGEIPYDDTRSIRDQLVALDRFVLAPTMGWVQISRQYAVLAPELNFVEKLRIAREGRRSMLLARQVQPNTNFMGGPKNHYSVRSSLGVLGTLVRRQYAFGLPGATDDFLTTPWTSHLCAQGVDVTVNAPVRAVVPAGDGFDVHFADRSERYDAVISTLFLSSLGVLLDASGIKHRLPREEHGHFACFTMFFDPDEDAPRTRVAAMYTHQGLGVVVQPELRRCTVLCIRTPSSEEAWVVPQVSKMLDLSHPLSSVWSRPNQNAHEALFIGDHVRASRIIRTPVSEALQIAGSWTRAGYPVDSGESAARSAVMAVNKVCRALDHADPPQRRVATA